MIDTIVCVLKSGSTVYNEKYVNKLMDSLSHYGKEMICLTDLDVTFNNCRTEKLRHNYPGWWSKIELFDHPSLDSKNVLYFDLDTIVKDDISDILSYDHQFTMISGFLKHKPNSCVMAFKGGQYRHIAESFDIGIIDQYLELDRLGDQAFIREHVGHDIQMFQDMFPNHFSSFKLSDKSLIEQCSVVCFHGRPRPHEVNWNWKVVK